MKAVILAGGQSRRMGHDKALLTIAGSRLIDIVYAAIKPQVNDIIISGPKDYGLGLETIFDMQVGPKGPVGALYSIWTALKTSQEEGFFTVPVDVPNFPKNLCERLYGDVSAIASDEDGMHQTFAWWRLDDLSDAFANLDLSRSLSLKLVAKTCGTRQVFWLGENVFYNINNTDDLDRYLSRNGARTWI